MRIQEQGGIKFRLLDTGEVIKSGDFYFLKDSDLILHEIAKHHFGMTSMSFINYVWSTINQNVNVCRNIKRRRIG